MTEKETIDQILKRKQEIEAAFERINVSDDLQPSAELDATILQMAADEVQKNSLESEESKVTDISDISFRRSRRESHKALKKKGVLPNWLMPMGLAATVLISFGVVSRVVQSPEFNSIAKSDSYESTADDVIVTSTPVMNERANKDSDSSKQLDPAQMKRMKSVNAEAKAVVNDSEMNSDISFTDVPMFVTEKPTPPPMREVSAAKPEPVAGFSANEEQKMRVEPAATELETDSLSDNKSAQMELKKEQHASLVKEKRERLTQARRQAEPRLQIAPKLDSGIANTVPEISSAGMSDELASQKDAVVSRKRNDKNVSEVRAEAPQDVSQAAQFDASADFSEINIEPEPINPVVGEPTDALELEEVSITGTRLDTNDLDTYLTSVSFEHKQCQVAQDCSLVALECDSCDCLEPVSNEHYQKYQSEFDKVEIAEQCVNVSVECVRNYCQTQQAE